MFTNVDVVVMVTCRDELMDGVMRFYVNDSSTTDVEEEGHGQLSPAADDTESAVNVVEGLRHVTRQVRAVDNEMTSAELIEQDGDCETHVKSAATTRSAVSSDSQCSTAEVSPEVEEDSKPQHSLRDVPDTRSSTLLCDEPPSQFSPSVSSVDGQSTVPVDAPPIISTVESRSVTVDSCSAVNSSTSTNCPSNDSSTDADKPKDNVTDCDVSYELGNSSPACQIPVMSLSCSSLANRLRSYIPSPGPLAQMYGGKDLVQTTSSSGSDSPTTSLSTSSSVRNSMLAYSPLKVGGDVSEITAKISAARLCSRNGTIRPSEKENYSRRWTDSFRSALCTADSRSTPWLAAGEHFTENLRSPSLMMSHSSSVSGSLSLVSPSSLTSSRSMTPVASRCSSLASNDNSTLQTSTLVPDNSRKSLIIRTVISRSRLSLQESLAKAKVSARQQCVYEDQFCHLTVV